VTALVAIGCALLGLLIGSFLNVVIWRIPRGESVVRPASHCTSCDTDLHAHDNIPVISWLLLRGKCRFCYGRISIRYPLVELGTGILFGAVAVKVGPHESLPAFLYLAAISVALALIDLDVKRLPNAIVLPSYLVGLLLLGIAAVAEPSMHALLRGLLGMAAYYGAFLLLVLIYPRGMGFGDVKLAGVLGLYLGYLGWDVLAVGAFGGVLLGGVTGIVLMASNRAGRKSLIPFGPFMLTGALVAIFAGVQIAHVYVRLAMPA
jgi:leader peptidase (prepilin peptidase)/N-methyltransferase